MFGGNHDGVYSNDVFIINLATMVSEHYPVLPQICLCPCDNVSMGWEVFSSQTPYHAGEGWGYSRPIRKMVVQYGEGGQGVKCQHIQEPSRSMSFVGRFSFKM